MSRSHSRERGTRGGALPIVLLLMSMTLGLAAAVSGVSLSAVRTANGLTDRLQAFHAADAALTLCTTALADGALPVTAASSSAEPESWRSASVFEARAFAPVSAWPGSAQPPHCIVDEWRLDSRPDARAFLITARGYGATMDTEDWLQLQWVVEDERIERHWRRVVARPF